MKSMNNLIATLAHMVPVESLIDQLEESIREYKASPTAKALNGIECICAMIMSKSISDKIGLDELIKKSDNMDRVTDLLDPGKQ